MQRTISLVILLVLTISITGCEKPVQPGAGIQMSQQTEVLHTKVDDWQYNPSTEKQDRSSGGLITLSNAPAPMINKMTMTAESSLGFATGGAKDVNNFRKNIENGYLPLPTDITYEGLFYNYFFDTGKTEECTKLFCPSYSTAVSSDPLSGKPEYYLSVGLNSGIKESDFQRKKLNLVVVMDISGSMGAPFSEYYYDRFGNRILPQGIMEKSEDDNRKTKMALASKSVVSLLTHLRDEDRFGLVLFDDSAYTAKPLSRVADTDMEKIKNHILELSERGGTNMESGMESGTKLLNELSESNPDEYENRIIFITDAMPNLGETRKGGLLDILENNSQNRIYTSFVGVGVDFNTELIEALTHIRGANYFSVHSADEFEKVLGLDFDYMVTPLVFNLNLKLQAQGYEIEKVYGSPEASESTGEIMKVNTLFPSKTEAGQTKGGIVVLKLNKKAESGNLKLSVTYEDRNGKTDSAEKEIVFPENPGEHYDNLGIRKAILLTRYANLMKGWLTDAIRIHDRPNFPCPPIIIYDYGIRCNEFRCMPPMPPSCEIPLGKWERQSIRLSVNSHYLKIFTDFAKYYEAEMAALGDESLKQELDLLKKLKSQGAAVTPGID